MLNLCVDTKEYAKFIDFINSHNLFIFQPPFIKATTGPARRPDLYISTCKELDEYIAPYQTIARLKDDFVAKVQYRDYEIKEIEKPDENSLFIFK